MSHGAIHGSESPGTAGYRLMRMPPYPGVAATIEASLV
jgi:hypothetical protein